MKNLTIKNIPEELYEALKRRARRQRRSINKEAIRCLESSLSAQNIDPANFLATTDALRLRLALPPLDDDTLRQMKEEGRP